VPRFTRALADFEQRIDQHSPPTSDSLVDELTGLINQSLAECAQIEAQLAGSDPQVLKEAQQRYREAIWPWFGQSWYMNHALSKPRGYAGDYQMLTSIYDGKVKSLGIGGYLDRYFLNTALGRAVKGRLKLARHFVLDELAARHGDVAILNVACGPCREYVE